MGMLKDFKAFINRGNAIDMAVGIIVGSVMTSVVNSLVKDVMMPPIGLLMGGIDFSAWKITLWGDSAISIGLFLNALISFLITMFAVFLVVRIAAKARSKAPVTTRACPYCQQSISKLATKCPYCCSTVKPEEIEAAEEAELTKGLKSLTAKVGKVASAAKKVAKIKK